MNSSIVRSEKVKKLLNPLGLLLILSWIYVVIFHHYSWADANQITFHLPLLVLWWVIFFNGINLLLLGILSWIGYFLADYGIIDEWLYEIVLNLNLFPSYLTHHGFVNPQYTKLILYIISLSIVGGMLVFKKRRTTIRSFAFLSAFSSLTVTLLIHDAIPFTTLKWERQIVQNNMSSVLGLMKELPQQNLQKVCENFKLKCFENLSSDEVVQKFGYSAVAPKLNSDGPIVFEYHRLQDGDFYRQVFGIRRTANNTYDVLIEEKLINKSQKVSEEAFGKLNTFANLIWGQILLLLGIFHTSDKRKSVFSK